MKTRRTPTLPVLMLLLFALYNGGYLLARGSHSLIYQSNHDHWHPEKRDNSHRISGSPVLTILYHPLILAERRFRAHCAR